MKCECGGSLTESEGEQICEVCGRVASGLLFGNNLSFTDYQLNGTNIDLGHQQYKYGRKNYEDVSTRRIRRAQEELRELARLLQLDDDEREVAVDQSLRIIKLADIFDFFNKGKSLKLYSAAALYIALRLKQAPYLLIDFSDKMGENLFKLARCYLRLVKRLHLNYQLPLLDPSVFIFKYIRNMEFGERSHEVGEMAIRLVQRMERDWMCQGRRPSSICGVAILIAAKFLNLPCTLAEISKTVYVCEQTIRRRIDEFKETPVARMTTEQFRQMKDNLGQIAEEMDPPSFSRNRVREKLQKVDAFELDIEVKENVISLQKRISEIADEELSSVKHLEKEEEVSDGQVERFILSPAEKELKQKLWRKLNEDWLIRQNYKASKGVAKPKAVRKPKQREEVFGSVEEALRSTRLGSKLTEREISGLLKFGEAREASKLKVSDEFNPFVFS